MIAIKNVAFNTKQKQHPYTIFPNKHLELKFNSDNVCLKLLKCVLI